MAFNLRFPLINLLLKPSLDSQAFLYFSNALLLTMLILEIFIDLTFEYQSTTSHLLLKLVLYFSIFIPNCTLLIIFKISPLKSLIFASSFLMASLFLRFLVCKMIILDFELIPFFLILLPLYTMFILSTPKPKLRVFFVFVHHIAIFSFLNLNWTIALSSNLKLLMSFFINLAIFWKTSNFLFQNPKPTKSKKKSKIKLDFPIQNDWKNLIDDLPQGIILISHDKNILYSNHSSNNILDLDSSTNSSAKSLFQKIVSKFGKLEEIQNLILLNPEESRSPEHGFTKIESSITGRKSFSLKKSFFGLNPVNIYSSKMANSNSYVNNFFGNNQNKDIIIEEQTENAENCNFYMGLGEKVNEKLSEQFLGTNYQETPLKIRQNGALELNIINSSGYGKNNSYKKSKSVKSKSEKSPLEANLEVIIDMMILKRNKTFKMYYSELSGTNKKRLELKVKTIFFKNSPVFLLIFQDVSFLKFFQQVCENNEYKNKVLTTLSHELRTPLNGALIPLEKLRNESFEKTIEMHDGLEIAYKSMVLLQNVLNNVVDFALINSNQLYLNYEELDLSNFLENMVELFRRQAQEKGLYLELIYDKIDKIPRVLKADFQRLGQILVSLLNNSLKNTFEGGISLHIDIIEKADEQKNQLKIIVEDTGVGIEEIKLKQIKKCLKNKNLIQVCENLNKNHGCGLGLIISHCLALLLGPPDSNGLEISSKFQKGTQFNFCLEVIQEKNEENQMMVIEEKTKEFTRTSPTNKTMTFCNKTFNTTFCNSVGHRKKDRIIEETQNNERNNFIDSECSREKKLCESERTTKGVINFLHSHTLETKNMLEITSNFCEVLITDDDSFNLMALEAILSKFKIKSVRAFNGQQAIDKILERHLNFPKIQTFSMVFIDYHMPIKNGLKATEDIIKMFREDGVIEFPIIACTAFGARDLVEKWSLVGASDFAIKPVSFQKIEGLLRKFKVLK